MKLGLDVSSRALHVSDHRLVVDYLVVSGQAETHESAIRAFPGAEHFHRRVRSARSDGTFLVDDPRGGPAPALICPATPAEACVVLAEWYGFRDEQGERRPSAVRERLVRARRHTGSRFSIPNPGTINGVERRSIRFWWNPDEWHDVDSDAAPPAGFSSIVGRPFWVSLS